MATCAPDLDDGELYLPPDFFPNEADDELQLKQSSTRPLPLRYSPETHLSVMRKLAALRLMERNLRVSSRLQVERAPFGRGRRPLFLAQTDMDSVYNGGFHQSCDEDCADLSMMPLQICNCGKASELARWQMYVDAQIAAAKIGRVPRQKRGGTGVFLPKIVNNGAYQNYVRSNISQQQARLQYHNHNIVGSVSSSNIGINDSSKALVWGNKGMYYQPSPEVRLPQDWTY